MVFIGLCLGEIFCAVRTLHVCASSCFSWVLVAEWPPNKEITANSAYDMFS